MLLIFVPLLVAIVGLLIFALSDKPKTQRIGEHLFWTGTLVTLMSIRAWKQLL